MENIAFRLENIQLLLERACELLAQRFVQDNSLLLREEDILADRADTQWVLDFLDITINPFKEHVKGRKLEPLQTIGQRDFYSKQEVMRLFWRRGKGDCK